MLLQAVDFTGYRLIRRTLLRSRLSTRNCISFSQIFVWMRPETTLESVLNRCGFGERIHWFRVDDLCGFWG